MKSGELKRAKGRIRREVLALRDALSPEDRAANGELVAERFLDLPEVRPARTVMLFWSFGSEVPTAGLIGRLHASGVAVALPRTEGTEIVAVTYAPGETTERASFGIEEPVAGDRVPPASLDVVAVPGVAFDRRCARIGYGGGFYDRFLRRIEAATIGLAFEVQVLDEDLPTGNFDLLLDAVVTEAQTIRRRT